MKRRQFAQTFALLAAGVALPAANAGISTASKFMGSDAVPGNLSRDFFEARIGRVFHLCQPKLRTLLLKGVEDACGPGSNEQFHVIFEANQGTRLEEGIYQLERKRIGQVDLFLTESEQGKTGQQFVAIINLQTTA